MESIRKIKIRQVKKDDWEYFKVWWKNPASSDPSNDTDKKHSTDKWLFNSFTRMVND
jgi:hypothetical protein